MYQPSSLAGKLFRRYLLFPKHPAKIRLQNWIGRNLFPTGIRIHHTQGISFVLPANDWITRTMIEEGFYEKQSLDLAGKLLEPGGVIIDIGANFGLYTCSLCSQNKKIKAVSIEPNYKIIPWLLNNLKINRIENRVQVINTAVAADFCMVALSQAMEDNIGTTSTVEKENAGYAVLGCSLEYIMLSNKLTGAELVKIDIEGAEFSVFESFPFHKYKIKNIILEFNFLSKVSFESLSSFFRGHGFELFTIDGKKLERGDEDIPEHNIWMVNRAM